MSERKGLMLVMLAAVVSGVSIFANSFAVRGFNPFMFTFLKNAVVAVLLFSLIVLLKDLNEIKALSKKQVGKLAAIGLVGGAIPFLLFFYALKLTTAINAGFLHKTLFIWATVFALVFLREKVSKHWIAGAAMLLAGNFLLFNIAAFGFPEMLVLAATILWAAENVLSKHVLSELSGKTVAFGRMAFGSIFILTFLVATNQLGSAFTLSVPQMQWALIASGLLVAFVFTYYSGLKHLPVHKAASVLLLAQPITALLSFAFLGKEVAPTQVFGLLLIVGGVFLAVGFGYVLQGTKVKGHSIAAERS